LDGCSSSLKDFQQGGKVKLSVKSLIIAAALFAAFCFLFVSLLNLALPPYGGALIALLSSLYLGYDPTVGPVSVLVGTLYSLLAGAVAGGLFGWLYNSFVEKF
jgi:phage-related minor tail protein